MKVHNESNNDNNDDDEELSIFNIGDNISDEQKIHDNVINDNENPPPNITVRVCDSVTCEMFVAKKLINELKQNNVLVEFKNKDLSIVNTFGFSLGITAS